MVNFPLFTYLNITVESISLFDNIINGHNFPILHFFFCRNFQLSVGDKLNIKFHIFSFINHLNLDPTSNPAGKVLLTLSSCSDFRKEAKNASTWLWLKCYLENFLR